MKRRRILLFLFMLMIVLFFCGKKENSELTSLEWIIGKWIADDGKNITKEFWLKAGPNAFEGEGITVSKSSNELINQESLRIVVMSGEIFYIAKVFHNEYPIPFKLINQTDSTLVFENKNHDFPNSIGYYRINHNQIKVKVRGGDKGFEINFIRDE